MRAVLIAVALAAACGKGGGAGDPVARLAHVAPASARAVVVLDGARLRATWLGGAARALRALVPADRGCLVDVALAAERAMVVELPAGRLVLIAAAKPSVECRSLSQVGPGVWLATLDGAAAPAAKEPRLADRPDYASSVAPRLTGAIALVAPDGIPEAGVVFAAATVATAVHAALDVELDSAERAAAAETWLRDQLAAAGTVLGDAATVTRAIVVTRAGATVTAALDLDAATAERDGPVAVIAAVAALAARRTAPAATAPTCVPSTWQVVCKDGVRFELGASLRATVEAAVRAAHAAPRVEGGQPAGVRIGTVPADGILAALGLRTGDAIIASDGRKLDTREAIDDLVDRLRRDDHIRLTVERGATTLELQYAVKP